MNRFMRILGGIALGAVTGCAATVIMGTATAAVFYVRDGGTGKYSAGNGILYVIICLAVAICGMFGGGTGGCVGICLKKTFRGAAVFGLCGGGLLFLVFLLQMCLGL
ncbi:MAG: hypothetical protein A2283_19650 [Lentisphaerae bacterium RIFOXYA12_FULL_48_11]|nr:MAG: hypothetical protein A2283_19650 [Lentisphaerae bacterium RIFOXYA12_FULL_48_11]